MHTTHNACMFKAVNMWYEALPLDMLHHVQDVAAIFP